VVAVAALGAGLAWQHARAVSEAARSAHAAVELHAPRVTRPISIDAADGKPAWQSDVGGTGVFKDDQGRGMVPYTEARVRWGDGVLYLWLYAGDLDLEGTVREADGPVLHDDAFHIELGGDRTYTIDVSVLGTMADAACSGAVGAPASTRSCDTGWSSGALVAVDSDGTLNKLGDNDEEWVVEMAIPLASIGLDARAGTRIPFAVRRCDVSRGQVGPCGGYGASDRHAEIVLDADAIDGPAVRAQNGP
jgi:hypothetical protein